MNPSNTLGFTWDASNLIFPAASREPKKPLFMLRKLMPQYVYDLVHLEGNPFTFVEVQTLIDGITIGGHKVFDQMQVLNQHKSLLFLIKALAMPDSAMDKTLACALHARIAQEEALCWGEFRSAQVRISGTQHQPPDAAQLAVLYQSGIEQIAAIAQPFERALVYFFWGALQQFFFDGNKRCARAMMNFILLGHGYYYLSVPAKKQPEFDDMMVDFYDSKDATAGIAWMLGCYQDWD